MHDGLSIFDRALLRKRRTRAAASFPSVDFLKAEAAARLCERLDDIMRTFSTALDLGCHDGTLGRLLSAQGKIDRLIEVDLSPMMLSRAGPHRLCCDEEHLPFAEGSLDAIFSVLSLHWVNDLPGALAQIRRALKPDGLFLAILPGARTLIELRQSLADAEAAGEGGVRPRVSPFVEVRDAGALLQRAGFALPVVDTELLTLDYDHPLRLMRELRAMGEANALLARPRHFTRHATLLDAMQRYQANHGSTEGRIPATIELVTLTAWAPDPSQQQPAPRGSGTTRLGEALQ